MPAIRPNCRSNGVATADAMVSGLAPGRLAETWITGNSTCGSGATGSLVKASAPDINSANVSSDVPIGRLMKGSGDIHDLISDRRFFHGITTEKRSNRLASRSNHK